jgi:hypothetical protein
MEINFKKDDIAALDFILKELSSGNTLVNSDDLINAGFLDKKTETGKIYSTVMPKYLQVTNAVK